MGNAAQQACGHFCDINEMCRRARVPIYQDDEMIGPKAPINASTIRRFQDNHPTRLAQLDQEDNQAGNKEKIYQPQVRQQVMHVQGNQQASAFQRRTEAHTVRVTRWTKNVSPTLYAEPRRFTPVLRDFYN